MSQCSRDVAKMLWCVKIHDDLKKKGTKHRESIGSSLKLNPELSGASVSRMRTSMRALVVFTYSTDNWGILLGTVGGPNRL